MKKFLEISANVAMNYRKVLKFYVNTFTCSPEGNTMEPITGCKYCPKRPKDAGCPPEQRRKCDWWIQHEASKAERYRQNMNQFKLDEYMVRQMERFNNGSAWYVGYRDKKERQK